MADDQENKNLPKITPELTEKLVTLQTEDLKIRAKETENRAQEIELQKIQAGQNYEYSLRSLVTYAWEGHTFYH